MVVWWLSSFGKRPGVGGEGQMKHYVHTEGIENLDINIFSS